MVTFLRRTKAYRKKVLLTQALRFIPKDKLKENGLERYLTKFDKNSQSNRPKSFESRKHAQIGTFFFSVYFLSNSSPKTVKALKFEIALLHLQVVVSVCQDIRKSRRIFLLNWLLGRSRKIQLINKYQRAYRSH